MSDRFAPEAPDDSRPSGEEQDSAKVGTPTTKGSPQAVSGAPVEREFTVKERTQTQLVLRRFFAHRAAVISLIILIVLALGAFLAPQLWEYGIEDLSDDISQGPSAEHPFGTDNLGHDYFALVLRGTQQSLKIAVTL